jgi:hypothetical protein
MSLPSLDDAESFGEAERAQKVAGDGLGLIGAEPARDLGILECIQGLAHVRIEARMCSRICAA